MSFYNNAKQSKRDKILHVSLQLFHTKGYFNTSVHEIQKLANVSIGLIYRYFKNKEEIAKELFATISADVYANIKAIIEGHENTHDRCRAIMAYYFELTETFPELVDFIIFARHQEIMPSADPICSGPAPELIRAMVREGIDNGELRPMHPAVAGPSIFGVMIRLIQLRLTGFLNEPLPPLLEETWGSAWRAVRP